MTCDICSSKIEVGDAPHTEHTPEHCLKALGEKVQGMKKREDTVLALLSDMAWGRSQHMDRLRLLVGEASGAVKADTPCKHCQHPWNQHDINMKQLHKELSSCRGGGANPCHCRAYESEKTR